MFMYSVLATLLPLATDINGESVLVVPLFGFQIAITTFIVIRAVRRAKKRPSELPRFSP